MNREFLLEAVLGITVGLLLLVLAVYRTKRPPKAGVMRRAGMVALLVYAVIAAQVLVRDGMTWLGVLLLLGLMVLAWAASLASRRASPRGTVITWLQVAVGTGVAAAVLVAAGQTLSMVGIVDPRIVVVVVAVVTGILVAGEKLAGSGRIGSLAMWLLIIPVLIALALGGLLGDPAQALRPIIDVSGPSWAQVIGLIVAFVAIGRADPGLSTTVAGEPAAPTRSLIGAGLVVLLICIGLLMFFGGAILAPSMQFFVVPANIDALPGLAAVLIAVLTVLFAGLLATALGGVGALTGNTRRLAGATAVAVVLALINPGFDWIVVATSMIAAAWIGSRSQRGAVVGLGAAVVAIVALTISGHMVFGWQAAVANIVVAGIAAMLHDKTQVTPEPVTG